MSEPTPPQHPWKRWIALLLLVVVLVITFIELGQWQLRRLDERRGQNATVIAHQESGVKPYQDVFTHEITDADQWQKVTVTGTYLPQDQVVVRYRDSGDKTATGWEAVLPLKATDGRIVAVSRGFKSRTAGTDFPSKESDPPSGTVTVTGYVRRNEQGASNAVTPASGSVRLINSDALATAWGVPLVNGYIDVVTSDPADPGGFKPIATPPLDEGPHLSYALQWFTFSLIAVTGLVVFIRNDLRDEKKAKAKAAALSAQDSSSGDAVAEAPTSPAPTADAASNTATSDSGNAS